MTAPHEISKKVLEVLPTAVQRIRMEMREAMEGALTVPQFRILAAIFRGNNRASQIAKQHGVSQAAMSKMVDGLVERGLIRRRAGRGDRRRIDLQLSEAGSKFFRKTRSQVQAQLMDRIASMSAKERQDLDRGMNALEKLFPR